MRRTVMRGPYILLATILITLFLAVGTAMAAPTFSNLKPANGQYVKTATPTISVKISGSLNPATIRLTVDSAVVSHTYDAATGIVSYIPATPLAEKSIPVQVFAAATDGTSSSLSSSFTVDATAPVVSSFTPATAVSSKPYINIRVQDNFNLNKGSLTFKLNGIAYPASIKYDGYWYVDESEETEYWVETDQKVALIDYYATGLQDGNNTVEITLADLAGNTLTTTRAINVQEPPKLTNALPLAGAKLTTLSPTISVKASDNGAIDWSRTVFRVDNIQVLPVTNTSTGVISSTPSKLSNEDYHRVEVTVYDTAGNAKTLSWQFYTYTWTTEMPVPTDPNKCSTCHTGYPQAHPVLQSSCNDCHQTYVPDCGSCHESSDVWWPGMGDHDGTYVANGIQLYHNFGTLYCTTCHNQTTYTESVIPRHNEPFTLANEHKSPTVGCDDCHATTLTREHVLRKDSGGATLTCETCHLSTNTTVKTAIANKNARCDACHSSSMDGGNHPPHTNQLDASCQSCHGTTLLNEPVYHAANGCGACHNSTNPQVIYAINSGNTNCAACHTTGHLQNLVNPVPSDIPLYNAITWSQPQPALIWAGESWFPAEYNNPESQMVFTERSATLSGTEVFSWYETQMGVNGWTKTGGPASGSNNFSLSYSKGDRKAAVFFYGGETHDPASAFVGYRIEILYK